MNEAIKFLTRERDSLNRSIDRLNEQEQSLNAELEETLREKVHAIHARNDINAALDKLSHDGLPIQGND